jgi:hypothetical protein
MAMDYIYRIRFHNLNIINPPLKLELAIVKTK